MSSRAMIWKAGPHTASSQYNTFPEMVGFSIFNFWSAGPGLGAKKMAKIAEKSGFSSFQCFLPFSAFPARPTRNGRNSKFWSPWLSKHVLKPSGPCLPELWIKSHRAALQAARFSLFPGKPSFFRKVRFLSEKRNRIAPEQKSLTLRDNFEFWKLACVPTLPRTNRGS